MKEYEIYDNNIRLGIVKLYENNISNNINNSIIEDNKIIGYIEYACIYDKGELNYIFIDPKYRSKGYGIKLLNYMFNDLKGVTNITLEVNVNNTNAIKLYQKSGFKIVSRRENYYNGTDGYLMLKEG